MAKFGAEKLWHFVPSGTSPDVRRFIFRPEVGCRTKHRGRHQWSGNVRVGLWPRLPPPPPTTFIAHCPNWSPPGHSGPPTCSGLSPSRDGLGWAHQDSIGSGVRPGPGSMQRAPLGPSGSGALVVLRSTAEGEGGGASFEPEEGEGALGEPRPFWFLIILKTPSGGAGGPNSGELSGGAEEGRHHSRGSSRMALGFQKKWQPCGGWSQISDRKRLLMPLGGWSFPLPAAAGCTQKPLPESSLNSEPPAPLNTGVDTKWG